VKVSVTPPIFKVVLTLVLNEPEEVCLTLNVSPFTAVPADEVYEPPFLLYVPPLTDTVVEVFNPATVISFEVWVALRATFETSVKVKEFGVVSAARVVEVKVSDPEPTVRVVFTLVLNEAEEVCLTLNVSPLTAVPVDEVYPPPFLLYVPPLTDTLTVPVMLEIVTRFEVWVELRATF